MLDSRFPLSGTKPSLELRSDNTPLARLLTAVVAGALHDSVIAVHPAAERAGAHVYTAEDRRAVVAEAARVRAEIDRLCAKRLTVGRETARELTRTIVAHRLHLSSLGTKLDRMRRDSSAIRHKYADDFRAITVRDDAREWFRSPDDSMPASDGSGVTFVWAVNTLNEIADASLPHPSRWLPVLERVWDAVDQRKPGMHAIDFLNITATAAA